MKLKIKYILFINISLSLLLLNYFIFKVNNTSRVAHAGGGIDGIAYTNSLKAINQSIRNGFKIIEIDFNLTSDSKIICFHHIYNVGFSYEIFLKLNRENYYPACDLEDIVRILYEKNTLKIISDVKFDNSVFLYNFKQNYPALMNQIIPQVYSYQDYLYAKELGFNDIIITLYRYNNYNEMISDLKKIKNPYAITLSKKVFYSYGGDIKLIHPNTRIYVHTVNKLDEYCDLKKKGISEIYTDFLLPKYDYFSCLVYN